jgi:hypothetical protein
LNIFQRGRVGEVDDIHEKGYRRGGVCGCFEELQRHGGSVLGELKRHPLKIKRAQGA